MSGNLSELRTKITTDLAGSRSQERQKTRRRVEIVKFAAMTWMRLAEDRSK